MNDKVFLSNYYKNIIKIKFENIEINCPQNYNEILDRYYGDWQTPDKLKIDHKLLFYDINKPSNNYKKEILINMKYYICGFIKDSHWYLDEWIKYHLDLGFTNIFLVEDIGSKSHLEITNKYEQVELYKFEDLFSIIRDFEQGIQRQIRVYQKFCNTHKDGWCAFIDDDEFIELNEGYTLDKIVENYDNEIGIIVPWEMYGANNHIKRCSSLLNSYIKNNIFNGQCSWRFKSFVNLSKEQDIINVHWFRNSVSQDNKIDDFNIEIGRAFNLLSLDNKIIIKHYFSKSWEDWLWKVKKRGNPTKGLRKIEGFFHKNPEMEFAKDLLMENTDYDTIDFDKLQKKYDKLLKEHLNVYSNIKNDYICDFKIMGIPSRIDNIDKLKTKLKLKKSDIFLDTEYRKNPMWSWMKTAQLLNEPNITHRVIIQDDIILCDRFKDFCNYLINEYPNEIFFLHNKKCFADYNGKYGSIFNPGTIIGGVYIVPIKYIDEIIDFWKSKHNDAKADDQIIRGFAIENNINYLTTFPSCVDIIQDEKYKSNLGHNDFGRTTKAFIKNPFKIIWENKSDKKPLMKYIKEIK